MQAKIRGFQGELMLLDGDAEIGRNMLGKVIYRNTTYSARLYLNNGATIEFHDLDSDEIEVIK